MNAAPLPVHLVAAAALALRHAADKDAEEDGAAYDVILLTDNVKDFAEKEMLALGVRVLRPGQLLDEAAESSPDAVTRAVMRAASELKRPPYTVAELLAVLKKERARRLVEVVTQRLPA